MATSAVLVVGQTAVSVDAGPVILGMACGAVGRISGTGPSYHLAIAGVAIFAGKRYTMVPRIIAGGMSEGQGRRPGRGGMTHIALLCSNEMTGVLPGGRSAVVTA